MPQGIKRHVGRIISEERNCYIVYRQIYDAQGNVTDPHHCLVIDIDSGLIPHPFNHELGGLIDMQETQETQELYNVLVRKIFQNGQNMLKWLLENKRLSKFKTTDIMVVYNHQKQEPLAKLNSDMERYQQWKREQGQGAAAVANQAAPVPGQPPVNPPAPHAGDAASSMAELQRSPEQEAQQLLATAAYLRQQAEVNERKAAELQPKPVEAAKPADKPPAKPKAPKKKPAPRKKPAARTAKPKAAK